MWTFELFDGDDCDYVVLRDVPWAAHAAVNVGAWLCRYGVTYRFGNRLVNRYSDRGVTLARVPADSTVTTAVDPLWGWASGRTGGERYLRDRAAHSAVYRDAYEDARGAVSGPRCIP